MANRATAFDPLADLGPNIYEGTGEFVNATPY
jgi:hypothetical protein